MQNTEDSGTHNRLEVIVKQNARIIELLERLEELLAEVPVRVINTNDFPSVATDDHGRIL